MQSDAAVVTYRGPVDCTAVARDARLVFVKNHIALSTYHGYKYAGWFGVDVWNLSTGRCRPLLMFDRYGRLDQLEVTTSNLSVFELASARGSNVGVLIRARGMCFRKNC